MAWAEEWGLCPQLEGCGFKPRLATSASCDQVCYLILCPSASSSPIWECYIKKQASKQTTKQTQITAVVRYISSVQQIIPIITIIRISHKSVTQNDGQPVVVVGACHRSANSSQAHIAP